MSDLRVLSMQSAHNKDPINGAESQLRQPPVFLSSFQLVYLNYRSCAAHLKQHPVVGRRTAHFAVKSDASFYGRHDHVAGADHPTNRELTPVYAMKANQYISIISHLDG